MSTSAPKSFRSGGQRRIRRGGDFARIRQAGDRMSQGCLTANWARLSPESVPRLGVISSRRLGGAVVRNRARRLMRETWRLHQHDLAVPLDLVLVARQSIVGRDRVAVEKDFLALMRKAGLLNKPVAAPPAAG